MTAAWRLLALTPRRMPVATGLIVLLYVGSMVAAPVLQEPSLLLLAVAASWLWHMMAGMTLRELLRPEILLLPDFRRHLAMAGGVDVLITILLPLVAMQLISGSSLVAFSASGMLLALAFGLATGTGLRITLVMWPAFFLAGWKPQLGTLVVHAAMASAWTPVLLLLLAVLILRLTLRPLFAVVDRSYDESPLDALADGRKPMRSGDSTPRRRGWLTRKLGWLSNLAAQRALQANLQRFRRAPTATARQRLIRSVLLPHDNLAAVALRLLAITALGSLYALATHASQRWNAGYMGGYAVILGIGRISLVGQGMRRMRPNLADLYMTIAPVTRAEFQAVLANVLQSLIMVAVCSSVVFAGLIGVLLHATNLAQLLLAAGISSAAAALCTLAAELSGPESSLGRILTQLLVLGAAIGAYALVYWLLGRLGWGWGSVAGVGLTLPPGIGVWLLARCLFIRRTPRFDAPLG